MSIVITPPQPGWIPQPKYLYLCLCLYLLPALSANQLSMAIAAEYSVTSTLRLNMRENSPYNKGGVAEDVFSRVECILLNMNQAFTIQTLPWKRAQAEVLMDFDHGYFPASKNKIRQEKYFASNLINDGFIYWFTAADSQLDPNRDSLEGIRVGTIRGTSAAKWALTKPLKLYEATDQNKLFELLKYERVKAVITSLESYKSSAAFNSEKKHKIVKAYPRKQYVFFSKIFINNQVNFLERFNAEIDDCIEKFPFQFL